MQVKFSGSNGNTFLVGTQAMLYAGGKTQYLEHMPMRGFQSSMDYRLHFGLGEVAEIDSLVLFFPDGRRAAFTELETDQLLEINFGELDDSKAQGIRLVNGSDASTLFSQTTAAAFLRANAHQENPYSDFDRDPLVYHMLSAEGPALCAGDFNGDGRTDFYRGGAREQSGVINLGTTNSFRQLESIFGEDKLSEDVACACFDADGDGDDDLYVVSGSSEFGNGSPALVDRLYFNEGGGTRWTKSKQALPSMSRVEVGSVVAPADYDGDGDVDLFVASRIRAGLYGVPGTHYLLENDGTGNFKSLPQKAISEELGMVSDAVWADVIAGGTPELVVVGEYVAPRVLKYQDGALTIANVTFSGTFDKLSGTADAGAVGSYEQGALNGWYNTLEPGDFNGDGLVDFALGNHGLNSRFRASKDKPVVLHVNDFDQNGRPEQILSMFEGDKAYPAPLLHDLVKQMPGLRKRYLKYSSFGDQTMEDIFSPEALDKAVRWEAAEFRSLVLLNNGDGKSFTVKF
ncbi:MAG: FG-GAP-like repeat-containing protein, partial [Bacteroidota bacterium]